MENRNRKKHLAEQKIIIIGAGPVGSYTAMLLAEKGFDVSVYEEHKRIGKPVQCTGIVTNDLETIFSAAEIKKFLVNRATKTKLYSKNNSAELPLKGDLIIDRTKFDRHLAEKAKRAGAKYFLNHRFVGIDTNCVLIKDLKNKRIKKIPAEILIGADGPASEAAKAAGIYEKTGKRKFMIGLQAGAKLRNENIVEFYVSAGMFMWVVPANKKLVRIGITAYKEKKPKKIFEDFLSKRLGGDCSNKIISKQAGLIPVFNPKLKTYAKLKKLQVFLVGDAAAQVKATTGGGIIPGLRAAECLAEAITQNKSYEKLWQKKIGKELGYSLKIRKILDKLNDKEYNLLIELLSKEKVKKIFTEHSREHPSKIMLKALLKEPKLLYFVKRLF